MKLAGIKEINGKITLKSGLHIGAGDAEMKIGGTDNSVIKHPYTQEPFIPGSSLKGKVRSLLEMRSGLMLNTRGAPVSVKTLKRLKGDEKAQCEKILKLFGSSGADEDEDVVLGPTRVAFADCPMNDEWRQTAIARNLPLVEVKSENAINRIKGTAENPRFTERVPADTEFRFRVSLKQMAEDEDLIGFLLEGLKLLEKDSLGGSGSRGYGRIEFDFDDPDIKKRFDEIENLF
ncbi:MAG: type III-A CRISPR-associated RAMP protein Csm3 [Desulfobacterales bacterium]|nr:type III-A CRISPR-associated RAMP protein Csm3 [Desulfobacterales bacterium]